MTSSPKISNSDAVPWIVAGDLDDDFTSDPIPCERQVHLWIGFDWLGTSTPQGTFKLQGSMDGVDKWFDLVLDADRVFGVQFTHAGPSADIVVNSAVDGFVGVALEHPPKFVRLIWTHGTGGAVAALNGEWLGRGA